MSSFRESRMQTQVNSLREQAVAVAGANLKKTLSAYSEELREQDQYRACLLKMVPCLTEAY